MEVGPWRVDWKGGLKTIEGGWEEYTTMVYGPFGCQYVGFHSDRHTYFCQLINQRVQGSRMPVLISMYIACPK
jgi:hypothetical protein